MKKGLKTEITREKIIQAAIQEFGTNGYEGASVNAVCERHQISKGLIYHNFSGKDEIYLICVSRVLHELTQYINSNESSHLQDYRKLRITFFNENPLFHKIFCEVIVFPPTHLEEEIKYLKDDFNQEHMKFIKKMIAHFTIRQDVSEEKMIQTICHSFDYLDAFYQRKKLTSFEEHDELALDILLHGLIAR